MNGYVKFKCGFGKHERDIMVNTSAISFYNASQAKNSTGDIVPVTEIFTNNCEVINVNHSVDEVESMINNAIIDMMNKNVRGKWVIKDYRVSACSARKDIRCSECGFSYTTSENYGVRFCPNCGAEMDLQLDKSKME